MRESKRGIIDQDAEGNRLPIDAAIEVVDGKVVVLGVTVKEVGATLADLEKLVSEIKRQGGLTNG